MSSSKSINTQAIKKLDTDLWESADSFCADSRLTSQQGCIPMLEYVAIKTSEYLNTVPKEDRKRKGQFFTSPETAVYMASLFSLKNMHDEVNILDPGAGTGILSTALVQRLQSIPNIAKISLTCYETDQDVLSTLTANLDYIKKNCIKDFDYKVLEDDYILSQASDFEGTLLAKKSAQKFDFVIGNPPLI